eukprot:m.1654446 g.1654446  ORF g.1654446 m.1654446 type:complete len:99 (+) comp101424_c0_seq1:36-332(+)
MLSVVKSSRREHGSCLPGTVTVQHSILSCNGITSTVNHVVSCRKVISLWLHVARHLFEHICVACTSDSPEHPCVVTHEIFDCVLNVCGHPVLCEQLND